MIEIPVGDLLGGREGSRKTLLLDDEIPEDEYGDLKFVGKLSVELELTRVESGVIAVFRRIEGEAKLPERRRKEKVLLRDVEREYKLKKAPEDPDDIGEIDPRGATIDVSPALREEALLELLAA